MDQPSDVPAGRYTNTDSVSPGRAANRLGRFGIAATEDELDAALHPEGVDATATPTTAQLMRSGLCQEPDQPQPDPASSHTLAVSTSAAAVRPGGRRS